MPYTHNLPLRTGKIKYLSVAASARLSLKLPFVVWWPHVTSFVSGLISPNGIAPHYFKLSGQVCVRLCENSIRKMRRWPRNSMTNVAHNRLSISKSLSIRIPWFDFTSHCFTSNHHFQIWWPLGSAALRSHLCIVAVRPSIIDRTTDRTAVMHSLPLAYARLDSSSVRCIGADVLSQSILVLLSGRSKSSSSLVATATAATTAIAALCSLRFNRIETYICTGTGTATHIWFGRSWKIFAHSTVSLSAGLCCVSFFCIFVDDFTNSIVSSESCCLSSISFRHILTDEFAGMCDAAILMRYQVPIPAIESLWCECNRDPIVSVLQHTFVRESFASSFPPSFASMFFWYFAWQQQQQQPRNGKISGFQFWPIKVITRDDGIDLNARVIEMMKLFKLADEQLSFTHSISAREKREGERNGKSVRRKKNRHQKCIWTFFNLLGYVTWHLHARRAAFYA